ncbi:MAG: RNA-binding cell elongation regulator Jag/EloR [Lachnospiraceae bacterium]
MDFIEVTAKTMDDAITEACQHFTVTSDKLEIEVIEEGSNGFLGFNAKQAKIRASVKSAVSYTAVPADTDISEEKKKVTVDVDGHTVEEQAKQFLKEVFEAMNMAVAVTLQFNQEDNTLDIDLSGEEMGILIGKRGQTLDSIQYLTSLVVNRGVADYIRVKVDTENYRKRRKETLENLAKNIAFKVKRSKHPISLEPMNPYERRIIHSALQDDKYVTTHSEGEEPFRKVVVTLK